MICIPFHFIFFSLKPLTICVKSFVILLSKIRIVSIESIDLAIDVFIRNVVTFYDYGHIPMRQKMENG